MKNLKLVFAAIAIMIIASCNKQASKELASEKMNAEELKAKYGIVIPDLQYEGDEEASASPNSQGKKKANANSVTLAVWFNDLTLSESGGILTTSISENAEWGGVQKWTTVDTTNNAVSLCNWNWSNTAAPATQTCNGAVTGFSYRSWTSDKVTYDIHVSAFLPL